MLSRENLSEASALELKPPAECRICFSTESPVSNSQYPASYRKVMLKNPCACRGSIAYIHEACLARWLLQRNIRRCELCHHPFNVREEYGSLLEIAKRAASYCFSSKRRVLKLAIYAVYLYLFCQRISFVVKYYKSMLWSIIMTILRRSSKGGAQAEQRKQKLGMVLKCCHTLANFVYNSFILVQLCCIGYTESFRIKQLYVQMLNGVKRLRIYDWKKLENL